MAVELNENRVEAAKLNYIAHLNALNVKGKLVDKLKKNFPNQILNVVMIGHGADPIEIDTLQEFLGPYGFQ